MSVGKNILTLTDAETRDVIKEIVHNFTMTVASTLGPGGRTAIIYNKGDIVPHVTKDGSTVAESIHFDDNVKECIISLLKESARKTVEEVGDGTTTSTLLSGKLIELGLDAIPKVLDRRQFFNGMNDYGSRLLGYIDDCKKIILDDKETIKNIIKIASNSDSKIVELLADIVDKIGSDGLINVEAVEQNDISINISEGASIDSINPMSEMGTGIKEYKNPFILLVEDEITDIHKIESVLKYFATNKVPAIIIAKGFSNKVIQGIQTNNYKGVLNVGLVVAEGFGINRKEILSDLAVITMAEIVSTNGSTENLLRNFNESYLGTAEKVIITSRNTLLIPNNEILVASEELIGNTIKQLKSSLKEDDLNEGVIRNIKRRLSKYTKVATIMVGGITQAEAKESKDRIDDAVCAITSAVNGGIIPGAGSILYIAAKKLLDKLLLDETLDLDFVSGATTFLEACKYPIKTILANAGYQPKDFDLSSLKEEQTIDVITGKVVNAYESGIIDPVMASIKSVENSLSIAKTLLNSSSLIIDNNYGS